MANIILIKRGFVADIDSAQLQEGEFALAFSADKKSVEGYIGNGTATPILLNGAKIASALSDAKSYTDGKISALIDGAPEAYDTLKEIAEYIATHKDAYDALVALVGNKITAPETAGTEGQVLKMGADGKAKWEDDNDTTYANATTEAAGLMSAADKTRLDGIADGAQVNVIEGVSVNGTAQEVTEKGVNITVPTKVSDIENDNGYQTEAQVSAAISAATVDGGTFGSYGGAE